MSEPEQKPEEVVPLPAKDRPVVRRSYAFVQRKDVADRVLKAWIEFKNERALREKK